MTNPKQPINGQISRFSAERERIRQEKRNLISAKRNCVFKTVLIAALVLVAAYIIVRGATSQNRLGVVAGFAGISLGIYLLTKLRPRSTYWILIESLQDLE